MAHFIPLNKYGFVCFLPRSGFVQQAFARIEELPLWLLSMAYYRKGREQLT
jgi:hypothetical protein